MLTSADQVVKSRSDLPKNNFIQFQSRSGDLILITTINKMVYWLSWLNRAGYGQICVARGTVSWGSKDNDAAGELQLRYRAWDKNYCLYASNTAIDDMAVCKVIVFLLFTSKSVLTKSKRY